MADPAIKLFGKTIPLRADECFRVPSAASNDQLVEASSSTSSSSFASSSSSSLHEEQSQKAQQQLEKQEEDKDVSDQSPDDEDSQKKERAGDSVCDHEPMELATPTADGSNMETETVNDSKTLKEQNGASPLKDQKTVKKPDKILPCPRCNSLDTKFCYYNNYNVNQPRHFCKNCQRYWTAGGTMRNVPVGAGRRKNKNSSSASSHYRHMSLSEALQTARNEMPEAIFHPQIPLKPNSTVLSFGSDSPLCESMASVLSLTEKAMRRNGFHRAEEERSLENGEEHSSGSSITASNSSEEEPFPRNCQGSAATAPLPLPCFPAAPWTYPWNSAQWSPPPPPVAPPPGFCASSFSIPFYPAPAPAVYWGCPIPGAWTIPWVSPAAAPPAGPNGFGSACSAPTSNSPTLGKHAREGDAFKQKEDPEEEEEETAAAKEQKTSSERCLWIPKTLRIDDPGEAARSSIWATLGIKKGDDGISGGSLFKPFQSKSGDQSSSNHHHHHRHNTQVLHANPAALSRSLNFQESS